MKPQRDITLLLLVISMLMPIIPVIPHHHHADGRICLKHDFTETCCSTHHHDEKHHSDDAAQEHRCNGDCVTMHFFEQTPGSNEEIVSTPLPCEITLFFEPIAALLQQTDGEAVRPPLPYYKERLHGTQLMRAKGLRAPPRA